MPCSLRAHAPAGRKNIVVVGDGRVVSGECSASGSQDEAREPLDVSVLHEALQAAFLVLQQPELDKLPPAPTVHQFREQFSDHPNDWAPQWGPGVTLQLVITPDPLPDPGLPLNMCSSPSTLASDVHWESQLQITRLPPFLLTVHSVPHYPASELPALTLEAPWMLPEALEESVQALKAIADDLGPGMPVLLAWLGWLRGESTAGLSKLTIATTIGSVAVRMCPKGWIEKVCTCTRVCVAGCVLFHDFLMDTWFKILHAKRHVHGDKLPVASNCHHFVRKMVLSSHVCKGTPVICWVGATLTQPQHAMQALFSKAGSSVLALESKTLCSLGKNGQSLPGTISSCFSS